MENIFIGKNKISKNASVYRSYLKNCTVEKDCFIFDCYLKNVTVKKGARLIKSVASDSVIHENSEIGPFAHIRPESNIGKNCKIGSFVEIKKSKIKSNTKCAHLAYVGDAFVGKNCNIGCGVVFANFNGKIKQKITVESGSFIGANVNLVAPLKIGKNCFIAAGTTIRKDLPDRTFVVAKTENKLKKNKISEKS